MKVHELITILQSLDQEAVVNRYEYSNGWGDDWKPITDVDQDSSGSWDHDNNCAIYEVYIQ